MRCTSGISGGGSPRYASLLPIVSRKKLALIWLDPGDRLFRYSFRVGRAVIQGSPRRNNTGGSVWSRDPRSAGPPATTPAPLPHKPHKLRLGRGCISLFTIIRRHVWCGWLYRERGGDLIDCHLAALVLAMAPPGPDTSR